MYHLHCKMKPLSVKSLFIAHVPPPWWFLAESVFISGPPGSYYFILGDDTLFYFHSELVRLNLNCLFQILSIHFHCAPHFASFLYFFFENLVPNANIGFQDQESKGAFPLSVWDRTSPENELKCTFELIHRDGSKVRLQVLAPSFPDLSSGTLADIQ